MDILQTRNPTWGFFGTIGHHTDQGAAWALAMSAIADATGCPPEKVRDSLDGKHGRLFADDILDLITDAALETAVKDTTERWMARRIDLPTERDTGIPRGLPYLTGYVCHAAHQADSELPRMRMMPADLGMAATTHDDAECARLKALEDA
jgi:hypothetical protein